MPKETAKQRKDREKAERLAAAQEAERLEFDADEDKGRQWVELQQRMERLETSVEFYERLVAPQNHLMVWRRDYEELRQKMQLEGGLSASRVLAMQQEVYEKEQHHSVLQQELVHLRTECKLLAAKVNKRTEAMQLQVTDRLEECINAIEGSIQRQRSDAAECAQHLHYALDNARVESSELAKGSLSTAQKVTLTIQENTSMHTRLPRRIRSQLQKLDKEDLLLILDTLSFEDSTLQHMLYRFPPGDDDPFAHPIDLPAAASAGGNKSPTKRIQ